MTISTTTSRNSHSGNDITTSFSFPYYFLADGDLTVILVDSAGTETTQTLTTHYTVTGAGNANGGTVEMVTAPATGETLIILRETPITQEVDYITGDAFPADSHETALDKLTLINQEQQTILDRTLRVSVADALDITSLQLPSPEAGKHIAWNSTATGMVNDDSPAQTVGAAYIDEIHTATAGQTVFTLTGFTYTPGVRNLSVYINGVRQYAGQSYTETDTTTVTFSSGLDAGDEVLFVTADTVTNNVALASSVAYTPAGTGAVTTNVQDKLRESVSVKDFGAVGDGVTDDTAAIQAALTTGEDVYFPEGTYITGKVTTTSNQRIYGPGTLKLGSGENSSVIEVPAGSSHVVIDGISVDGDYTNNTGTLTNVALIALESSAVSPVSDVLIINVTVKNAYRKLIAFNDGCTNCHIRDCYGDYADQESGFDLCVSGTVTNVSCTGSTVLNTQKGNIVVNAIGQGVTIADNICDTTDAGSGASLGDNITAYNEDNKDIIVSNNQCSNSGNHGIHVSGDQVVIADNRISDCAQSGIFNGHTSVSPEAAGGKISITGNIVKNPSVTGIISTNFQFVIINSNNLTTATGSGYGILVQQSTTANAADKFNISNNVISGFANDLIRINGDLNDGVVSGNLLTDGSEDGIQLGGGTNGPQNIHITGNRIKGCNTGVKEVDGNDNSITGNNFEACTTGITLVSDSKTICHANVPANSNGFYTTAITGSNQTINLPADGPSFHRVSAAAAATVDDITPKWPGREVLIYFTDGNVTLNAASSTLFLNGGTDKAGTNRDTIRLVCDGTNWFQSADLMANS